jgi:hypothetical protein
MTDDDSTLQLPFGQAQKTGAPVTDLATRRCRRDVLHSITIVFGGVHYGTIIVEAPYAQDKPIALYVVPARGDVDADHLTGPLDCLITDDASLVLRRRAAQ